MKDVKLSSSVTIAKYRELEDQKSQGAIADFVAERFTERYITPLRGDPGKGHGFCTMAICCLMVEALESFWQGWPHTRNCSEKAFCFFFERCEEQGSSLGIFSEVENFYEDIRCGILHQAETTGGWRIRRTGPLCSVETKTINATEFHNELEAVLKLYCDTLRESDWESDVWRYLREKMEAVIANCDPHTR